MLFSSAEFIFGFLPVTFLIYFVLARTSLIYARLWLLLASIFFYGWWNPANILLITASMAFNFIVGSALFKSRRRGVLALGVSANVATLFYYKYANFFIGNLNLIADKQFPFLHVVLPLGISFFTFTQIAYLVDCYQGKASDYKFSNYCLFVTFFPHLIAGPIVHHTQLMPQFEDRKNIKPVIDNITRGIFVFNIGLAKKLIIADTLSTIVANGYSNAASLSTSQAWFTSLAYSIQLYFDFSGYSDMAIGLALLFNIDLPPNFNSPYKSINIQEFWRRWHITLSRFLRDYIYVPLGGNRRGEWFTARNLMITFVLGGIWHGAGWTFAMWGFLHGTALVIHRLWTRLSITVPGWIAVPITFLFVNVAWVFFRAPSWHDAISMIGAMTDVRDARQEFVLVHDYFFAPIWVVSFVLLFLPNSTESLTAFKPSLRYAFLVIFLIVMNILFLNSTPNQEFLYFDF